ncbi:hypothetical protein FOZ63_005770, partial [Perkinsus olseni]
MALVINITHVITCSAAFVAVVGTTTPNATTSPSPDPLRPGPSGDDLGDRLWWLLAEREIEGLLKEEQQAAEGPLHGVEIHYNPAWAPPHPLPPRQLAHGELLTHNEHQRTRGGSATRENRK